MREAQPSKIAHVSAIFFHCYKCSEPTMSLTPFGVYCQGCGLRSFTDAGEARATGTCSLGHRELARHSSGALRCLVCSVTGGYN